MEDWVQFAVKVKKERVKDDDLIKHYFYVDMGLAEKVTGEYKQDDSKKVCEREVVEVDLAYHFKEGKSKLKYTKGYAGSIEVTCSDLTMLNLNVSEVFSNDYKLPDNAKGFLS